MESPVFVVVVDVFMFAGPTRRPLNHRRRRAEILPMPMTCAPSEEVGGGTTAGLEYAEIQANVVIRRQGTP